MNPARGFSHRFNSNGTIDSICHTCFSTVGTALNESDLESCEERHTCDPQEKLRFDTLAEEAKEFVARHKKLPFASAQEAALHSNR